MLENVTSEKMTKYPKLYWVLFIIGFSTIGILPVLGDSITQEQFNFALKTYMILFIIVFIYSIFGAYCVKCRKTVKRKVHTINNAEAIRLIEKNNLKKPYSYEEMIKGEGDWEFHVNSCDICKINHVISFCPKGWG